MILAYVYYEHHIISSSLQGLCERLDAARISGGVTCLGTCLLVAHSLTISLLVIQSPTFLLLFAHSPTILSLLPFGSAFVV